MLSTQHSSRFLSDFQKENMTTPTSSTAKKTSFTSGRGSDMLKKRSGGNLGVKKIASGNSHKKKGEQLKPRRALGDISNNQQFDVRIPSSATKKPHSIVVKKKSSAIKKKNIIMSKKKPQTKNVQSTSCHSPFSSVLQEEFVEDIELPYGGLSNPIEDDLLYSKALHEEFSCLPIEENISIKLFEQRKEEEERDFLNSLVPGLDLNDTDVFSLEKVNDPTSFSDSYLDGLDQFLQDDNIAKLDDVDVLPAESLTDMDPFSFDIAASIDDELDVISPDEEQNDLNDSINFIEQSELNQNILLLETPSENKLDEVVVLPAECTSNVDPFSFDMASSIDAEIDVISPNEEQNDLNDSINFIEPSELNQNIVLLETPSKNIDANKATLNNDDPLSPSLIKSLCKLSIKD